MLAELGGAQVSHEKGHFRGDTNAPNVLMVFAQVNNIAKMQKSERWETCAFSCI